MSETQATYTAGSDPGFTLADLAQRNCARLFSDPRYEPPTPQEVSGLIKLAGWSQSEAAKLVGVQFNPEKGSTTIRKWRAPASSREHREIPYSAWRLMLICAGVVEVGGMLRKVAEG